MSEKTKLTVEGIIYGLLAVGLVVWLMHWRS